MWTRAQSPDYEHVVFTVYVVNPVYNLWKTSYKGR